MKILSLSGENLASLTGPFTIDFAGGALGISGLFAITGNTRADGGKSMRDIGSVWMEACGV
ncbi:exonuclease SbcC [Aeromonas hydrophila]|jgi:DNA repair exonuclease SbcCD ATPase subunit|uniref:exonuclease SbcC n=1 Tax=Aeromonas TaxID=642 RepID=UPI00097DFB36|nr:MULTISPECIES: exonuclease SbcC [Aeromonas]MCO4113758.1 exonuclease SbcC [Aeromonas hydrophila]MCV9382807.1 exonuclease SbcC [Aeromonas hydrophila]ONG08429.1 exonuclease SbcC [Aeromonas hydrophila]HDT5864398.1 exonuclease SbcC [Aeromonas hydrophila subsp. hydrophila]